jgi:hypothetical protein
MESPLIFPGLGPRLSSVIHSLCVTNEPAFSIKCNGSNVYLNIVWSTKQRDPELPEQKKQESTATKAPESENKSPTAVKVKRKKRKSPSTLRRDKRRLAEWLARKKYTVATVESMECDIPARGDEPISRSTGIKADLKRGGTVENLDALPEVAGEGRSVDQPPAVFMDPTESDECSSTEPDSDADLFLQYTTTPINQCHCSMETNSTQLRVCMKCFKSAICFRPKCKEFHEKYNCEGFKLVEY